MLLAKTKSSCTTYIGNVCMHPWKVKMLKPCFLTNEKKGKSNEMLKIPLEGYKKRSKKSMVKYMLYPNIVDLINLNMSRMKAAISCAFKHR